MEYTQEYIAKQYAKKGIKVFPCTKKKKPICKNGFKAATTDIDKIEKWWGSNPNALVGSPNDQFTVIDIDDYNVPDEIGQTVTDVILSLKEMRIINQDVLSVTTMSGGTHLYYHKDSSMSRMIHVLPQIDVLGEGGYVILPDQKNYVATEDAPWEYFEFLPKLDVPSLISYADTMREETRRITREVKQYRGSPQKKKPSSVPEKKDTKPVKTSYPIDEISFDIKEGIYKRTDKDIIKSDPYEKILNSEGKLVLEEGQLDSRLLMRMFYNKEIQVKLCQFLGLDAPSDESGSINRSILPGHLDLNPSMGVRWSQEGSHLLIRDFSNHFSDKFEQTDFNLVRLYAVLRYGTNVPRLNAPEFTMWFLRMLIDSSILNIDKVKSPIIKSTEGLTEKQLVLLESIQLLDAVKKLHSKYDGQFVAADKFTSAWSGLPLSTCNRNKKILVERGFLLHVGEYNCCKGREDGFYYTNLYQMPVESSSPSSITIKDKEMKLSEAVNIDTARQPTKPSTIGQDKEERDVQSRYPSLSTYAGFIISPQYHQQIKHFAEDFDIDNVPSNENMIIPTYMSDDYKDLEDIQISDKTTYYVDKFTLELVDGMGEENNQVLMVHGVSPPIEEIIHDGKTKHGYDIEDLTPYFVISSDVGDDFDESRLEYLEIMFNQYVPFVGSNNYKIFHMTSEQILKIMDGKNPISEDNE